MNISTKVLTRSALILAIAIAIQSIKMPPVITGPLVNTLLFIAVATTGSISGVLVGLFTPVLAFAFGIMPMAPAVPVIMAGNVVLALLFGYIKNQYIGFIAAALAKFVVMTAGVYGLLYLVGVKLPPALVTTLSTTQLITALEGGVLALLVLKALQVYKENKKTVSE